MSQGAASTAGGKARSGAESSVTKDQRKFAGAMQQLFGETKGLRDALAGQFESLLKTGGTQATIPIIGQAMETSKQATSQSLRQTEEQLAQQGLSGTPFGASILANQRTAGNIAGSQIPTQINQEMLKMIPQYLLGQLQAGVQGITAAQGNISQHQTMALQQQSKQLSAGK